MDPNATLRELIKAATTGDSDTLRERATDLADWIDNKGFLPQTEQQAIAQLERDEERQIQAYEPGFTFGRGQ